MRRHDGCIPFFAALVFGVVSAAAAAAADPVPPPGAVWDRFRGPNGSATTEDRTIPLTFGPKENVLWKIAVPGGNSSPIVWGKFLFLHASSDDGKQRSLICVDASDGKTRWQKSVPAVPAKIRFDSSLASSTPTTDGSAVFVSFWDGKDVHVSAFDFQGDKLWSRNLGVFNSQHGAGASPILAGDKLILANDMDREDFNTKVPNPRPSILTAFDKRTGQTRWEAERPAERACYSAPFLLRRPGAKEQELVVVSTTAVTSYDPDAGTKLWEAKGWQGNAVKSPMRTVASPALAGDILCVACGGDAGRLSMGFALPASGASEAPKQLWENRKDLPYVPSPLARGDHFYFVNDAGAAGCCHARTGKREWFERIAEGGFHASPLLVDGKIYAISAAGDAFVVAAEPAGFRLLARNELGETVRATPAVADGRLYVRTAKHLYCFGKAR